MNYKSALLSPGIGLEDWTSGALGWEEHSSEDAAPGTETRRQDQGRWEVPNLNLARGAPAFFFLHHHHPGVFWSFPFVLLLPFTFLG